MKKKLFVILFAVFLVPCGAFAQERIVSFDADFNVNENATVDVVERIVYDFGDNERHGIFRIIPVKYSTDVGLRTIKIKNIKVSVDNSAEDYKVTKESGNLKIRIGSASRTITGKHSYQINYTLSGVINYFEDYDEFYWNVTGFDWPVEMQHVVARVRAPSITNTTCFKGEFGSTKECDIVSQSSGEVIFDFGVLPEGTNGTIVVGLEKGVVYKPTAFQKMLWFMLDNWVLFLPLIAFIWAFDRWYKHGRDPKGRGTIVPYYDVPDNLSVAQASAVLHNGLSSKDISAMIIQLAVKGFIKIKRQEAGGIFKHAQYIFTKSDLHKKKKTQLTSEEQMLFREMFAFGDGDQVTTDNLKEHFYTKIDELKQKVSKQIIEKGYLPRDSKYDGGLHIVIGVVQMIVLAFLSSYFGAMAIVSGVATLVILIFFAVIMGHRTKKGVEMKEKLLGLKMYLETAEKDRIKFHNAPEKNPERFEKLLPFAMIFGVEKEWAKQFEDIYKQQPEWYEDPTMQAFNTVVLADSLHSFASDTSSSLTSSPSSASSGGSGFSGGGSGGGFGGGGGGSW